MADRKYTHGLNILQTPQGTVLDIGDMEIWDGADLSLIRDTLFRLILQEGELAIAVDMHAVQYVPSGFFGMLFDWMERGVAVRLINPRERVRKMLWFRRFFTQEEATMYRLHNGDRINEHLSEDLWRIESSRLPVSPLPREESRISSSPTSRFASQEHLLTFWDNDMN